MAELKDFVAPKWWLDTKRGIGMFMVGLGTAVPVLGAWFGVTLDPAVITETGQQVAVWFDVTWNIVGFVLWVWGSFRPTAPLAVMKP